MSHEGQTQPEPSAKVGSREANERASRRHEFSMVKKPQPGADQSDAVLTTGLCDLIASHGATGLGDVADAVSLRLVDVVPEGDVAVRCQAHVIEAGQPAAPLLLAEGAGGSRQDFSEPRRLGSGEVDLDVADLPVDALLVLDPRLEGEAKNL